MQRLSKARNGVAHPDVTFLDDLRQHTQKGNGSVGDGLENFDSDEPPGLYSVQRGTRRKCNALSAADKGGLLPPDRAPPDEQSISNPEEDCTLLNYPAKHYSGIGPAVESTGPRREDNCSERTSSGNSGTADEAAKCKATEEHPPKASQAPSRNASTPVGRMQDAPTEVLPTGEPAFHAPTDLGGRSDGPQSHLAPRPVARSLPCVELEDYRNRIMYIYRQYNPPQLLDVDSLLAAHKDREYILYTKVRNKYNVALQPLHPATLSRLEGDLARDSVLGSDIQRTGFVPPARSEHTLGVPSLGLADGDDDARSFCGPRTAPMGGQPPSGRPS
jgi:hypothetical protein